MGDESDLVKSFHELPKRIFLDSSTLQTLQDYGEFIWENVEPSPSDRLFDIPDGYEQIDALRAIFFVNQRAMFEFALSKNSFEEVAARGDQPYLRWADDVLEHWESSLAVYRGSAFSGAGQERALRLNDSCFGYLSAKDRSLLQDTLALDCDAFLTMDHRLARNAEHLRLNVGLRILMPVQYWYLLRPWAALLV